MPFPPVPKERGSIYRRVESAAELTRALETTAEDVHSLYVYLDRLRNSSEDTVAETVVGNPSFIGPPGPAGAAGPQGIPGPGSGITSIKKTADQVVSALSPISEIVFNVQAGHYYAIRFLIVGHTDTLPTDLAFSVTTPAYTSFAVQETS